MLNKKAGALLAISSLPSDYGIGDFGENAYNFIDIIDQMGIKIWQVLPLNPLGFGNSPYQAYSSFAGDSIYISIDKLIEDELITKRDADSFNKLATYVDYDGIRQHKNAILEKAYANFKSNPRLHSSFTKFLQESSWVYNYAVFITFKKLNGNKTWNHWSSPQKNWIKDKQFDLTLYHDSINFELFIQFIFYKQWMKLKTYANNKGIEIMGDIPIYTGYDSVDVWENQDIYLLDEHKNPSFVAGVPPDFFSETGQLWGNPLYDWNALRKTGFKFWIERLRGNAKMFDIIRIDHFRAFDTYWKIPGNAKTAIDGEWVEAPGYELFDTVYKELPDINIVAEDLGDLRPQVLKLRDHYNLKGMKVFQFHFKPNDPEFENTTNCIIYTGTHDNNTLMGWYDSLNSTEQKQILSFFETVPENLNQEIIKYVLNTKAKYVIFPIQDIIGLDATSRMNTPGQIGSPNWEWKLTNFTKLESKIQFMANEIKKSGR